MLYIQRLLEGFEGVWGLLKYDKYLRASTELTTVGYSSKCTKTGQMSLDCAMDNPCVKDGSYMYYDVISFEQEG